ncbi:TetR/AcrR family transcriptional regulator [Lederbergia wuyishanensis]|uniref:AcrR family transcriptional regulator n=1 Tax=Lederbergia wuyishanensis TaxID=1347903 RepID=A0ABU0DA52_9BACI|nr:TetR/AcrR family transcriptional regulator [Lederbergia wuyishanensis]MCJ8008463.1 TetR/AcrR family transcriptional regulator [Lederbergia wuyishanensis]MDQ0345206.1 AcrR family transcriptional regulator [Lederbergia wuyishanensis]
MTKDKILEAAIHQYSLHNYHGATMQKIAKEVGIKPASIYFFYKNKESLFVAAFQKLLEDHFKRMQSILEEVHEKPILDIFATLIKGTVEYHKNNMNETNAYISLVTSPPAEIKKFLHDHMNKFDKWMIDSLHHLIKRDHPKISDEEAVNLTRKFILLLDGIFWEINLYDDDELSVQIEQAVHILEVLLGGNYNAK